MDKEALKKENELKKEYLRSYLPKLEAAKRLEQEIEECRQAKTFSGGSVTCINKGGTPKDLSDYRTSLAKLEEKLVRARYERVRLYSEIFTRIEDMENELEKEVLKLYYIKGRKWEDVCMELHYSWKQIHRYHVKALEHFKMA